MEGLWVNAGTFAFMVAMFIVVFKMIMRQRTDLSECKDALSDFKEKVAETYASDKRLDKLEERIIDRIGTMERKVERLFNSTPKGPRA